MCGIALISGNRGADDVQKMLAGLSHRGPDGEDTHAVVGTDCMVGHRRLAIIDPQGGAQPLVAESSRRALVANGMIYNCERPADLPC